MAFTVELKGTVEADAEVEIYLDKDALEFLMKRLELLQKSKSHAHFATPSWAGNELTENKIGASTTLINQLRITFVPQ
jgi:Immunity protein 32